MSGPTTNKKPNHLINAGSPYLKQHAYNPVEWYPWGEEALAKAKNEDKPIIVSIGYSSCHWCHVMERESFENDSIAQIMNEHFISIKVDREERPDIDQLYMEAVQAMGVNGGWPLNVFLTPDQKPFYGGTYFPPQAWAKLLTNVAHTFEKQRNEIEKSADDFTDVLATSEIIKFKLKADDAPFSQEALDQAYLKMAERFDHQKGGFNRAPKFPMPSNWLFLLRYYHITRNAEARKQVEKTLDEIALGGISDQVGGGFARYSVDADWHVPHFEKMLYDNGQLISLYAEAYTVTQKDLYKEAVYKTIGWLEREMEHKGGFFSALDADSEGEEGKFYVWGQEELEPLLNGTELNIAVPYYDIQQEGNWEEGKNILHRRMSDPEFAKKHGLGQEELKTVRTRINAKLLKARGQRVRPGLDDKILAGWNGLMLKGLVDAYEAFQDDRFLDLAVKNASFLERNMISANGKMMRGFKNEKASIDAYLEDYAAVINAFIALYQVTFDEKWIELAKVLNEYVLGHFYDDDEQMFFFTDNKSPGLIARKKEIFDNVIPSSNSIMAINLYLLGVIYDSDDYKNISRKMLGRITPLFSSDIAYVSNWAILYTYMATPTAEISIVGNNAAALRNDLLKTYHPNKVVMGTEVSSSLPLMEGKYALENKGTIYVCYNKTCQQPVHTTTEALEQLHHGH